MENRIETKPLGELFADVGRETSELIRQEIALAKIEMRDKATQAAKDAMLIAAGGAIAYAGTLAIVVAIILALGLVIPMWASALLIGALVLGIGFALLQTGLKSLKRLDPAPRATLASVKRNTELLKEQLS